MKKFVLYTNALSAHQIPLAREIVNIVGPDNFRYIYTSTLGQKFQESKESFDWIRHATGADTTEWLEDAEVMLVGGIRPIDLIERRARNGKTTFYMSERWFKPPLGMFRLLHPRYFFMAWRIVRLIRSMDSFIYLPIGIHAARDMARLCGLFSGDLRCLFRSLKLDFECKPGGRIWLKNGRAEKRYCLDKMRMWGYYVEPSTQPLTTNDYQLTTNPTPNSPNPNSSTLKVLWVGRLLNLKRVDTIVRAVGEHANLKRVDNSLPKITLDIYGTGPEEVRLKKLAAKYGDVIKFNSPVPINDVRKLMREHDVYVLASNAYEGWGAVVSEALEEGMKVIGTYEAGASATLLPKECLFYSGDKVRLIKILKMQTPAIGIGKWTAKYASEQLVDLD